ADGGYSAHCLDEGCVAFYYGVDDDSPKKTYALLDVLADGTGVGEIEIWFGPMLKTSELRTGDLGKIVIDEEMTHLTFEFVPAWLGSYGPIVYDLRCNADP